MKKALIISLALALVLSLSAVLVSAADVSEEWTTGNEDFYTMNDDGSLNIKGTQNTGLYYNKEISGDFTLELQATAAEVVEGTDQKFTMVLFAKDQTTWETSGIWFRFFGNAVEMNDGTNPAAPIPTNPCTVNLNALNDVKVEYKSGTLTYYVNGTMVAEITPSVTTGYICIGANYYGITEAGAEFTVRGLKLTMGGETVTYFGEAEDLGTSYESESPASSEATTSSAVSSTGTASSRPSVSIIEPTEGGCGNKAA